MNEKQFTEYIASHLKCQPEIAETLISLFTEAICSAIAEGYQIELDNLGIFAKKILPKSKKSFSTKRQTLSPNKTVLYFKASPKLKAAATVKLSLNKPLKKELYAYRSINCSTKGT